MRPLSSARTSTAGTSCKEIARRRPLGWKARAFGIWSVPSFSRRTSLPEGHAGDGLVAQLQGGTDGSGLGQGLQPAEAPAHAPAPAPGLGAGQRGVPQFVQRLLFGPFGAVAALLRDVAVGAEAHARQRRA